MQSKRITAAVCAALLLSACAGMTVSKIDDTKDRTDEGLRFYRNVPYLLITTNNQGGVNTDIIYLPNTHELFSANVYGHGASNETTLSFSNSVLTSATVDVDTSVIPKAVLGVVASVAAKAFNLADSNKKAPGPYLYRIKVTGTSAQLIGSDEIITINIGTEAAK